MSRVILDGENVDSSQIDPQRHILVGNYRTPWGTFIHGREGYLACPCGQLLANFELTERHYQEGHFDIPMYTTVPTAKSAVHVIASKCPRCNGNLVLHGNKIYCLNRYTFSKEQNIGCKFELDLTIIQEVST